MLSLVYASAATVSFSQADLLELLGKAREKNRANAITGMLLYKRDSFIQVLEGDESAVQGTFNRIARDPRHRGCLRMLCQPISERQFPDWEMGFRNLHDPQVLATPGYSDFLNDDFASDSFRDNPGRAMRLLQSFRRSTS